MRATPTSERTLKDVMAKAELKRMKIQGNCPVHIDETDLVLLADEVLRLREEKENAWSEGYQSCLES
jgi:hypothetical protein